MTDNRHAGTYVKAAREQSGLVQVDLCQRAGISQPTLSQIEGGKKRLTVRVAWAIERALDLEPDTLVRWSEDMPANLRSRFGANPGYLGRHIVRLLTFPAPTAVAV